MTGRQQPAHPKVLRRTQPPAPGAPPQGAVLCRAPRDGPVADSVGGAGGRVDARRLSSAVLGRVLGSAPGWGPGAPPRPSWLWWELEWTTQLAQSAQVWSQGLQWICPSVVVHSHAPPALPPPWQGPGAQARGLACWPDLDTWPMPRPATWGPEFELLLVPRPCGAQLPSRGGMRGQVVTCLKRPPTVPPRGGAALYMAPQPSLFQVGPCRAKF